MTRWKTAIPCHMPENADTPLTVANRNSVHRPCRLGRYTVMSMARQHSDPRLRNALAARSIEVGTLVIHPWHPRWGPGRVVAVENNRAFVYFRDHLRPKAHVVDLRRTLLRAPDALSDPILCRLPSPMRIGNDFFLPGDYRRHLVLADPEEIRQALARALGQVRTARLTYITPTAAMASVQSLWLPDHDSDDDYDLSAPQDASSTASLKAYLHPDESSAALLPGQCMLAMCDEFIAGLRAIDPEIRPAMLQAVHHIALAPADFTDDNSKPLPPPHHGLWIYKTQGHFLAYKPLEDQYAAILLVVGLCCGPYAWE